MTQYFQSQDGTMHSFPDDATPAEIDAATKQPTGTAMGAMRSNAMASGSAPQFTDNVKAAFSYPFGEQLSSGLNALGHHLGNIPIGLAQLADHAAAAVTTTFLPDSRSTAINANLAQRDAEVAAREEAYQKATPNSAGAYTGAGLGEIPPWIYGLGEARALGIIPTIGRLGQDAGLLARTGNLAARSGVQAGEGATIGAAQPVTGTGPYAQQKAAQVATGGLIGGGIPVVAGAVGGIINGGKTLFNALARPDAIAAQRMTAMLGSDPATLAKIQAPQSVGGYTPTTAEAYAAGGAQNATVSARLVAAERQARNANGAPFAVQDAGNDAARSTALQGLAGDDTALEAAQKARTKATQPFIDANLKPQSIADRWNGALQAFNGLPGNLGQDAGTAIAGAKKIIQQVISGKMQEDDAVAALKDLHASVPEKVGGGTSATMQAFDAAHQAIDQNMHPVQPILDAIMSRLQTGIAMNPTVGAALRGLSGDLSQSANTRGMVSGDILDGARQNANRYLAKNSPNGYFSNQETAGIAPIKSAISDYLQSRVPGYSDYLAKYAKGTQPITDMESVGGLLDKAGVRGSNIAGDPRATLTQLGSLLKSDDAARYPMSAPVRQQIENILSTMQARSTVNNVVGASGPGTAAETIASKVAQNTPRTVGSGMGAGLGYVLGHALGIPESGDLGLGALGMKVGDTIGAGVQQRNAAALANLLQNPQAAAAAVRNQAAPGWLMRMIASSPQGRALLQSPQARALLPVSGISSYMQPAQSR